MPTRVLTEWKQLDAEPGAFSMSAWRGVNIYIWYEPSLEIVARIDRATEARRKEWTGVISGVHIVAPNVAPPDTELRAALVDMANRWGDNTACIAAVLESSGLVGLALRSVVTGITMVMPKHYRVKVFDTLEPCADWVAEQSSKHNQSYDPAELLVVLKHARRAAGP